MLCTCPIALGPSTSETRKCSSGMWLRLWSSSPVNKCQIVLYGNAMSNIIYLSAGQPPHWSDKVRVANNKHPSQIQNGQVYKRKNGGTINAAGTDNQKTDGKREAPKRGVWKYELVIEKVGNGKQIYRECKKINK